MVDPGTSSGLDVLPTPLAILLDLNKIRMVVKITARAKHAITIVADLMAFTGAILVVVSIFNTNVTDVESMDDHDKIEQLVESLRTNQKYVIAGLVFICIAAFLRAILLHIFEFLEKKKK